MNIIKAFFIYAFLGWIAENLRYWQYPNYISCNPIFKQIFSKNICYVPFPPSYGLGGIFIYYLHEHYPNLSWLSLVILFILVFNLIELVGGYIGEKYICNKINTCEYKTKMWDYKNTHNFNGYIDVEHSIYWALLGLIGYSIYPYLMRIPNRDLIILMIIIWLIISIMKYPKESID